MTAEPATPPGCPLCSAPSRHRFSKQGYEVRACSGCGLLFTTGPWSLAQTRAFYGPAYFSGTTLEGYTDYSGLEAALSRTMRRRLARLPRGGRLLDIGCATGIFVGEAGAASKAVGTDVSLAACHVARGRGLAVAAADAAALPFATASHDVVTMWDTLEHCPDPLAVLTEVARVLRPDGTLVLSTGDVASWCARLSGHRWHLFTLPEHRYFFSRATLEQLLARAGLRCTACYHDGAYYSPAYLAERLVKSLLGTANGLARVSRHRLLRDTALYIDLRDVMIIEAVHASPRSGRTHP